MRKHLALLILIGILLFTNSIPVFPQAYTDPSKLPRTYSAGFSIACGGAGDCVTVTLTAGGSNVTAVRELWISQPSSNVTVSLIRRSALDTGGTSTTETLVSSDTNDAAPNTIVTAYTAAPTAGSTTGGGTFFSLPITTTSTLVRDSTVSNYKPFLLQGATQVYAIYVSGAATVTVNLVVVETP